MLLECLVARNEHKIHYKVLEHNNVWEFVFRGLESERLDWKGNPVPSQLPYVVAL